MATLVSITLENYRSIQDPLQIKFPRSRPVILLGENNAGKSNIVKGVNLLLGNFWPGSHDPEDQEFYDRDWFRTIRLTAEFSASDLFGGRYTKISWKYNPAKKEPFFRGYPGRYGDFDGFISGDDRDTCVWVVLEAERNLGYQLGYSSKFTLLSRLMHKFHKALAGRAHTKAELETLFGQIKKKFSEIPEFAEFTTSLRRQLGDLISTMTHRLEVDFEAYNPANFFHALRLHANDGTSPCTLEEMGTGETQILAISFAHAFAKAFHGGIVLVIEEPESHLHPLAQQWLARKLHELSNGGLQILITTHSPHFIDIMSLDGLVLVRKDGFSTYAVQLSARKLAEGCADQGARAERVHQASIGPFYTPRSRPKFWRGCSQEQLFS